MMVICRIIPISLKCKGIPNLILQPFENFSAIRTEQGVIRGILHMFKNAGVNIRRKKAFVLKKRKACSGGEPVRNSSPLIYPCE